MKWYDYWDAYHAKREFFFYNLRISGSAHGLYGIHMNRCANPRWVRGSSTPFSSTNGFVYSCYCMSVFMLVTIGIFMLLGSVVQKIKTNPSTYRNIQLRYSLLCQICPLLCFSSFLFLLGPLLLNIQVFLSCQGLNSAVPTSITIMGQRN